MLRKFILFAIIVMAGAAPLAAKTNQQTAAHVFLVKMGKGDFSGLDRIYAPGFVVHSGGKTFTLEQDNESGKALRAAAPDVKVSVERMAGEDELVAVHWRATGTNTVASAGMPGNGKRFDVEGMTFFRFEAAGLSRSGALRTGWPWRSNWVGNKPSGFASKPRSHSG